jgi:octaprenyl-diphosphate synthase
VGKDFFEGKVTLPIILLFQKIDIIERKKIDNFFKQEIRSDADLSYTLNLIKKNNIISECYKKADYFINLASNSLSIFEESKEKIILEKLTSFSLERNF